MFRLRKNHPPKNLLTNEIDSAAHKTYAFMEKHMNDSAAQMRYLDALLSNPNGRDILKKTRELAQQRIDNARQNFQESPQLQDVPAMIILDLEVMEERKDQSSQRSRQPV